MKTALLTQIFLDAKPFFSEEWKEAYKDFLEEEHLHKLAKNLLGFYIQGVPKQLTAPLFNEEITPLLEESFFFFKPLLDTIEKEIYKSTLIIHKDVVKVFERINFKHVLLLMGQRITSATIQDAHGIPPLQKDVLEASFKSYNSQISKVLRAFEKHTERTANNYWGIIRGNPSEKEEKVKIVLENMLANITWWNVFYHYKHELLYEIRIPSGHGARWKKSNLEFIGFVEPFLN